MLQHHMGNKFVLMPERKVFREFRGWGGTYEDSRSLTIHVGVKLYATFIEYAFEPSKYLVRSHQYMALNILSGPTNTWLLLLALIGWGCLLLEDQETCTSDRTYVIISKAPASHGSPYHPRSSCACCALVLRPLLKKRWSWRKRLPRGWGSSTRNETMLGGGGRRLCRTPAATVTFLRIFLLFFFVRSCRACGAIQPSRTRHAGHMFLFVGE